VWRLGIGATVAAIALSAVPQNSISAQRVPPLRPGIRMRAWMAPPDSMVWTGYLVTIDDRLLVLRAVDSAPEMRLWLRQIERLDVSRGHDPLLTTGGPIAGAVLGTLLAPALIRDPARCDAAPDDPACAYETPKRAIGAAAGAVLFGIATNLLAKERWVEFPLEGWVGTTPSGWALRIGVRLPAGW
jgi:hypothetical protein